MLRVPTRRRLLQMAWLAPAGLLSLPLWAAEPTAEVDIRANLFVPEVLTVKAGTTVRWTNNERRTTHSVLFLGEGGFESERFFPGESWQRRFDKPGRYAYSCGPHPEMKGLVIVTE